jgi:hypothetical protein
MYSNTYLIIVKRYKQKISKKTYYYVTNHIIKTHYHATAISYGKFEKAIEMYEKLINNYEDIREILEFLLYICRINILKVTMTSNTDPSTLQQYLSMSKKFMKTESQLIGKSEKWNDLIEEFNLYSAYLNKDINKIHECIQYFRRRKKLTAEFHAINIWFQILPQLSDIQIKLLHYERLQHLLRMCELTLPYIKNINDKMDNQIEKRNFEDIFCIIEVNDPQKRQLPFGNPLLHMHKNRIEDVEVMNNQHICNVNDVHLRISRYLAARIFELIWDANQKGRNIPDISSQICYEFKTCQTQNCLNHHVIPTPLILHKRLELACLQYTVMLKLSVLLCCQQLFKGEQNGKIRVSQRWWAEILVKLHIRYQSPQISCPEVTCMVLAKLSNYTRREFIEFARKTWLYELNNNVSNFEVMLKFMFIFQQLKDEWGIDTFNREMSKTTKLLTPNKLPIGFEYYDYYDEYHRAIPVGKRLSLFYLCLRSHDLIKAIFNIRIFIQYAIDNIHKVNLVTTGAFGDLVSLTEFATSLIFAVSPRDCDFFLSRAYLVNYFDIFTATPLIPNLRHAYNQANYSAAIMNSFKQIKQLLNLLINEERTYFTIILRLIRLLVLIGLNESAYASKVLNIFKYLNNKISSKDIKKYLQQRSMGLLLNVLHNDLKETDCDSLVIVYYQSDDTPSKFSKLEKHGIIKLAYGSIKGFHSALQQIKSSVTPENQFSSQTNGDDDQNTSSMLDTFEQLEHLKQFEQPATSEEVQAAKKIQVWFRQVYKPVKPRPDYHDPISIVTYNSMMIFCQALMEEKGKKAVNNYNNLLTGRAVNVIVELIRLQGEIKVIKNRLKKIINNHPSDTDEIDRCLELEDELKLVTFDIKFLMKSFLRPNSLEL